MPYVHVVFTLPHQLSPLALDNTSILSDLLFRASAATLLEIAADPKHLGADIGFMSVLHTWGQNVLHHPHAHCERAEFNKLTPEQQHAETLKNCADLLRSWEFKTYSELSVTERRMKAACMEQLAHPDALVFR